MAAGQAALRVAGDHEVVHLGEHLVGEIRGGHALGAVARPREGHQQRGHVLREASAGVGDQVGGGDRVDAQPQPPGQCRLEYLSCEGGGPGAGEYHAQVAMRP